MPASTISPSSRHWYLIRHGETDCNARHIVQGSGIDAPLNARGQQQAQRFHVRYQKLPFQMVFTSALQRTHQTVAPFLDNPQVEHHILPELNEISWGELEGREGNAEVRAIFHETIHRWSSGELNHRVPGGESPLEVLDRLMAGLQLIDRYTRNMAAGAPVLLCSHGRTLRVLLAHLLGFDLRHMQLFEHHNTGLNLMAPAAHRFYALRINDTRHLLDK